MKKSANTSANKTQQIGSTAFGVIFWLLLAVLTAGVSRAQDNLAVSMSPQTWRTMTVLIQTREISEPARAEPTSRVRLTSPSGSALIALDLKTGVPPHYIDSDQEQKKRVSIGWIREAWVYSNGKLVFADRNLYGVPQASKAPDGRLGLENGSFDLPLHKGRNEIVIAVDDNLPGNTQHYG